MSDEAAVSEAVAESTKGPRGMSVPLPQDVLVAAREVAALHPTWTESDVRGRVKQAATEAASVAAQQKVEALRVKAQQAATVLAEED